ncbi:ABC transporter substrate-binding protein [Polaromonas jejuensis]|uniref:ABC transporter substrate-binding protein n=1 Tax=Polaromonas jejuensis TaxID=457502 RepID=A0ABW0QBX4_9BURK|nr:extracellular solute-binding protein [Polaromonas jejuensis]
MLNLIRPDADLAAAPYLKSRRDFLQAVTATAATVALPSAWARATPQFGTAPVPIGIIDVAGNLALTQKIFDSYASTHTNRVSRFSFTRAPAPELAGKLRAMQAANRVELHIVLTGLDGIAAGIEQGVWQDLSPYHAQIGAPSALYDGGAAAIQSQAGGSGMLVAYSQQGPVLEYIPSRLAKPPKTLDELLAWTRANPKKFFYARPANSGPGRTFVMALPYMLGDKDPMDPVKGWDKTWAYLKELNKNVEYYPSGTTPTMRELAQGSRDLIASTMGWDIYPRVQGIVPKEAAVVAFDKPIFVADGQFAAIPKGLSEDRLAVALDVLKFMLQPTQQAMVYADGYLYPGPARKGITLAQAPAESQKVLGEFGRLPFYEPLLASTPVKAPLEPKSLIAMFRAWDEQIGGQKVKS